MDKNKPKIIALYLPQFHPTPHNNVWWGKGFTEWTNVGKAKPLYPGHYQPKVPADLGYYDLRLPEVREAQVDLAREAGIYGFCYYHYWFGNGSEELELPFNEVLRLGKPNFPFMLCWANESWHKKFWNKDGVGTSKQILIEQKYPGEQDIIDHFYRLLPAFKDNRYIKVDGKPMFMIYRSEQIPDISKLFSIWNNLAIKEGLPGIHFVTQLNGSQINIEEINLLLEKGFSGVNVLRLQHIWKNSWSLPVRIIHKIQKIILRTPNLLSYKRAMKLLTGIEDTYQHVYPTLLPNWDHTPRSGLNGHVLTHSSPKLFKEHCRIIFQNIITKDEKENFVFLKSWNEWGEGNYIEPDIKYGHGWINAIRTALDEIS